MPHQREHVTERPQGADGVAGWIPLQEAGLGQTERATHRVRVTRGLFLDRELCQGGQVLVRAVEAGTGGRGGGGSDEADISGLLFKYVLEIHRYDYTRPSYCSSKVKFALALNLNLICRIGSDSISFHVVYKHFTNILNILQKMV